ncbi:transcription antitermination factor NusB [Candidatus Arthromitus sp. SFB-turkey]|uniref:transcription antitermination factor NusB n=1 Tax=Candidatus Arthromitus sp. SFB-turkey TaxID=1840217 RepID=UPI0007F4002E|nr:transcription antitermination factor NusB [Candidatus Arthromitus sp. SFB-turkey]OAT87872.1 transcription antitermination factor NusB [Candidatus Arthromitus sp. SFB-turkey]HJD00803.1 transcription antitermination factor NusB [Candidatus Dwaynia gallinarum]
MNGYRSKSRELVFQIIFGLNFYENKMDDYEEIINEFESELKENDYEIDVKFLNKEYCLEILNGIKFNQLKIDDLIQQNLKKWKLERLSKVDLSILRLATYEMCFKSLDPRIAINEAVNLSKKYSGDKSSSYINGVLNSIKDVQVEEN